MKKNAKRLLLFSITAILPALMWAQEPFFENVPYKGAFGQNNWLKGWTALDHYGFLSGGAHELPHEPSDKIDVHDSDINPGDVVHWTADHVYVLNGFVFVEAGAVLRIDPGTIIKGKPGQGESASALIICRGGKIYAEGTADHPIIFTAESDDVSLPDDIPFGTTNLWGGVILLGRARTNLASIEGHIEGIPPTEPRGTYGGTNDDDSSGVLRYVSIRHGGTDIGEGNEINGLTLGAVGRGTVIDYVEVFNNNDDGFEFFGGTVDCKHLVSAFNADDAFDFDEGYRGRMQFLFAIQAEDMGNRCGEHDGGREPEDGLPYAHPVITNATYLGSGKNAANPENDHLFKIRDNWGGEYYNSIFGDFVGNAMDVEDLESGHDSRERLETGDIQFEHNIWFRFGAGETWQALGEHDWESAYLANPVHANVLVDPQLKGISRLPDGGLDPRPDLNGPAYQDLAPYPTGVRSAHSMDPIPEEFQLLRCYPNPFNPSTQLVFHLPRAGNVEITVFDARGRRVTTLAKGHYAAGRHTAQWVVFDRPSGVYLARLKVNGQTRSWLKMTLLK